MQSKSNITNSLLPITFAYFNRDIVLTEMVYIRGGQSAALQLVFAALEPFVTWKKIAKNQINTKFFKKCLIFLSISIKNDQKGNK
jgi:hypothetical protein